MKKYLFLLIILAALFVSSGQTYEQQSLIPRLQEWLPDKPLENTLSKIQVPYWGRTVSVESRGYYYFLEFLIRKGAHLASFGLLASAIFFVLPKHRLRYAYAFILTVIAASADEIHQMLTGGRTPYIGDVVLDAAGGLMALTLIALFRMLTRSADQKNNRRTAG
ncbi:VanZ family protein [Bhargavaea ullalensis]|uniref:VanZ-like domain-containing protein n=1 Tax=Bhargavaea ullalensis TaxID=1265685 RepID=A0ABV2GAW1_9BACL